MTKKLLYEWDLFKKTWIESKNTLDSEDTFNFIRFDNFITCENNFLNVQKMVIIKNKYGRLERKKTNEFGYTLFISQSPFRLKFNQFRNNKSSAFLLQNIFEYIIDCLKKNNQNIIIVDKNKSNEEDIV